MAPESAHVRRTRRERKCQSAFPSDTHPLRSAAGFAAGADLGKDATLAGLLEKHAGVTVTGVSAFEVGALAIAKTEEEGDGSA